MTRTSDAPGRFPSSTGVWATIAVSIVALITSGCFAPVKPDEATGPADGGRRVQLNLTGIAWVHVVVAAEKDLRPSEFQLSIQFDFSAAAWGPQVTYEYTGILVNGLDGGSPSEARSCADPPPSADAPRRDCAKNGGMLVDVDGADVTDFVRRAHERGVQWPLFNVFVAALNVQGEHPVRIEVSSAKMAFNLTYGDASNSSLLYLSDFGWDDRSGGDYALALQPRKSLLFNFFVQPVDADARFSGRSESPSYRRPDGSEYRMRPSEVDEFSQQSGQWNFKIPAQNVDVNERRPSLWQLQFDRASIP